MTSSKPSTLKKVILEVSIGSLRKILPSEKETPQKCRGQWLLIGAMGSTINRSLEDHSIFVSKWLITIGK